MEWHLLNYMRKSRHNILNLELLLSNILSPDIFYSKDKLIKTTTKITVLRIREKKRTIYKLYIFIAISVLLNRLHVLWFFKKKKKKLFNKKYQDRVTLRFIKMHKQFTAGVKFNDKISDKSVPFQTRCYVPLVIATENVQY